MATAPFDWAEYLRLATDLSQNPDEASHRTSISRAYYSVYHAASAQAIRNGYPSGQGSHARIWKVFAQDQNKASKRLAQLGNTMKRVRELADYRSVVPQIPAQMTQQLLYANNFLAQLATLPTNTPQP
jgi:uncharacterized protein (UPF0332 family)